MENKIFTRATRIGGTASPAANSKSKQRKWLCRRRKFQFAP
jgi:hypothetical protein